jgi:hypothetical protein
MRFVLACLLLAACGPLPQPPPLMDANAKCHPLLATDPGLYPGCVRSIEFGNEIRRESWARYQAQVVADDVAPAPMPAEAWTPPPIMPTPTFDPVPVPLQYQPPAPVQTWGQTPYAAMVPPVMRDRPVTEINPMIPPAAR